VAHPAGWQLGAARFRIAVAPSIAPVRLTPTAQALAECAGRIRVRATVARLGTAGTSASRAVEFVIRAR
jgi:hypothetical protein